MSQCESNIDELEPIYFPNELNLVSNLFLPILKITNKFDCMSGYFTSSILSELSEPLSYAFCNKGAKGRFIVSPCLTDEDKNALFDAYLSGGSIYNYLIDEAELSNELKRNTCEALKYLIATGRLDFKVVVMKSGMMHAKAWIFDTEYGSVVLHGSSNATLSGLMRNFEQVALSRSWDSKPSQNLNSKIISRFESFWNDIRDDSYTISLNEATMKDLFKFSSSIRSDEELEVVLDKIRKDMSEKINKLSVPEWLDYKSGEFKHQGLAINAWFDNGCKGIINIATGGGKTLTSLVCAAQMMKDRDRGLVVIAVPTKPLIKQWCSDVRKFSIEPYDMEGMSYGKIRGEINRIRRQHAATCGHDVIVLTHDAIKDTGILNCLRKYNFDILFIADEVHNLGAERFIADPPSFINYRLGLSATPERQYDSEGTGKLLEYFGGIVFEFSLSDAIGVCLVPFNYYINFVYLTEEEEEKWLEYTQKINKLMWSKDSDDSSLLEQYLIRRRAVYEGAHNKINEFHKCINNKVDKRFTLVFCTDKDPTQLEDVNAVLVNSSVKFHQVTSVETSSGSLVSTLLDDFQSGRMEVLTSKRVLDEGFNIPSIKTAYFIASSGTIRTWIQRLGRVLRMSPGKKYADVYDFVVLPSTPTSDFKALIDSEYKRVAWFCSLSKNGFETNGNMNKLFKMYELMEGL